MLRTVDLVLRFVYVAFVPFIVINLAMIMPISGILIGAALATAVALFGTARWRERVGRVPVAGRFLANMARLGDFYNERPPRPLLFYVLYPVVLPYVLINKHARSEFLLFRRLNVVALAIIIITNGLEYARHWYPDLPFNVFMGTVIGILILQILVAAMFVMPIVTTILVLHQRKLRKTLIAMVACALVLVAISFVRTHAPGHQQLGAWTSARLYARTRTHGDDSRRTLERSLDAAVAWGRAHAADVEGMEARAGEELETFYLHDEAAAFHLFGEPGTLVVLARAGVRPPIWRAVSKHEYFDDPARLSPGLRKALRLD